MKMFVTLPANEKRDKFFPLSLAEGYSSLLELDWNEKNRQLTAGELASRLKDVDFLTTGWGCPKLEKDILEKAEKLKLVIHLGGSVAQYASEELYDRGVKVISGNQVMARFVAEAILSYILCGLRSISHFDQALKRGELWPRDPLRVGSLYGKSVGFIGLGTVGRYLLDLLVPFRPHIRIFDPFINNQDLKSYPFCTQKDSLDQVLNESEIVSIHASLNKSTKGMVGAPQLALLKQNSLLINAARAGIIDRKALLEKLSKGCFRAVLDVYHEEPLPIDDPLRSLENVTLLPHLAGVASHSEMAPALLEDVERFILGKPLHHEIRQEQFRQMTNNKV